MSPAPASSPERRLLTIREAAERTAIPEGSFRKRLSGLGIPIYKFGASVRIDAGELEAWIESHRQAPRPMQLVDPAGRREVEQ
jgi:excisionase family DNA binding protein